MAPAPKPEGARVRRNANQKQWTTFVRGSVPAPEMPDLRLTVRQRPIAEAYWLDAWAECGPAYTESTKYSLATLVGLRARILTGAKVGAQLQTEARQLEEALLLTPKSRRSAWIQVVDADKAEQTEHVAPVIDMRARLASVSTG